jgi:hypothetical protein
LGPLSWAAIGVILTFSIFLANVIYRVGHLSARVEEIERWRLTIRQDMHEISDILTNMTVEMRRLSTLIEERTGRTK